MKTVDSIDVNEIVSIAKEAGKAIMEIYSRDFEVVYKEDESPLTEADLKSHNLIIQGLKPYGLPILSEEGREIDFEERREWEYYWCIDPIDGTKEFIKKNDEFTVNIALIHKQTPVLGVVYAPALGDVYYAKKGSGAFKNSQRLPIKQNISPQKSMVVVASKSHLSKETETFIDGLRSDTQEITCLSRGSSLKLVMVAEGEADVYPRLAPTMEWDTAAADAIVRESGKMTYQFGTLPQKAVVYNKADLLNPWFVVR